MDYKTLKVDIAEGVATGNIPLPFGGGARGGGLGKEGMKAFLEKRKPNW